MESMEPESGQQSDEKENESFDVDLRLEEKFLLMQIEMESQTRRIDEKPQSAEDAVDEINTLPPIGEELSQSAEDDSSSSDDDDGRTYRIVSCKNRERPPPFDFEKYTMENLRDRGSTPYSPTNYEELKNSPSVICSLDPCEICDKDIDDCGHYEYDEIEGTYLQKFCYVCVEAGHWVDECEDYPKHRGVWVDP